MTRIASQSRGRMRRIFRDIYEDNLRIAGRSVLADPGPRRWRGWVLLGLAGLLVTFDGRRILPMNGPTPFVKEAAYTAAPAAAPEDDPLATDILSNARQVPLAELFGLGVKTIVIDPGHGGGDPGAIGPTSLTEKSVALEVARRLRNRLEQSGFHVLMTRSADIRISLKDRVRFAIDKEADLFVSVHVNALPDKLSTVETYYFGRRTTEKSMQLAMRENANSGYTRFEWQRAINSLGDSMKITESKLLATAIQSELYRGIREANIDVINWGIRPGPFEVLLGVPVPAVLTEVSVISTPEDESLLYTSAYLERIALALDAGIRKYLRD